MKRDVHLRSLKLDKTAISDYAYRELYYFCRQHREKQRQLNCISGPPEGRGEVLKRDVNMLEQVAKRVAGEAFYRALMENVVDGKPYVKINIPASRHVYYYNIRRQFYYELAREMGKL